MSYREKGERAKGLHVRLDEETARWLDTASSHWQVSKALLIQRAIQRYREHLAKLDEKL
jgi:predicted DNA-binding protein